MMDLVAKRLRKAERAARRAARNRVQDEYSQKILDENERRYRDFMKPTLEHNRKFLDEALSLLNQFLNYQAKEGWKDAQLLRLNGYKRKQALVTFPMPLSHFGGSYWESSCVGYCSTKLAEGGVFEWCLTSKKQLLAICRHRDGVDDCLVRRIDNWDLCDLSDGQREIVLKRLRALPK